MGKDYYTLLGVDKSAGEAELKKGGCPSACVSSAAPVLTVHMFIPPMRTVTMPAWQCCWGT
jgi:hypothetical protein